MRGRGPAMSLRCCWLRDAPQWVCSNCDDIVYRSILHITNRNNTTQREWRPDTVRLLLITPFDTISPFFTWCLLLGAAHCTELTITPDHNQGQWQYIMRLTSTWNLQSSQVSWTLPGPISHWWWHVFILRVWSPVISWGSQKKRCWHKFQWMWMGPTQNT